MRYYSNLAQEMTLTAGVSAADTVLSLSSVTGLPASFPFTLVIEPGGLSEEVVTCTALFGTSATVTRGADGTSATTHGAASKVRHMLTAQDLREPQEHIAATTNVHGVGSGTVVSTTLSQTLINKTLSGLSNSFSNIPKAAIPTDTVYTTGAQTLTGKSLDGATNTFTNVPKTALPVDTLYTTATQTVTGKSLSGASNTFTAIPAATALTGIVPKANLPADTAYSADLTRIAAGQVQYDFAGGSVLTHTISFPVGRFTSAPYVSAVLLTGLTKLVCHISAAPTTTSVAMTVNSVDGSAITGTVYVQWVAVQEG